MKLRSVFVLSGLALLSLAAGAAQPGVLGHAGRWLTDPQGRVVVIHGMNYGLKSPVTLPDGTQTLDPEAAGFGAKDLDWMAANGLNGLRIFVQPYGLEPAPGVYDDTYVAQISALAQTAANLGVSPLIDFHQDDYGPLFEGDGFADWATLDDGLPLQPQLGFPFDQFAMPALLRAWDHFWNNSAASDRIGLQDHFAATAAHVAEKLAGIPGLLGYEYLNEPWPGTQYATCIGPLGCPLFDLTLLTDFNRKMDARIRAADAQHLIFAEPNSLFNDGIPSSMQGLNDAKGGFAFHVYCLLAGADGTTEKPGGAEVCPALEQLVFENADHFVARTGEAQLMTEFGATPDLTVIGRLTTDADVHMTSWLWWAYDENIGLNPAQNPPDQNLNQPAADLLVRVYPQLVSGTPLSWSFDPAAHAFIFQYSTERADGTGRFPAGAITQIFVPARHYPTGYYVAVTGGTVVSAGNARILQIASLPGAQTISVTVAP
jgi:endoglycosylceramidase